MKKTVSLGGVAELAVALSYVETGEKAIQMARRVNGYPNRSQVNEAIKEILKTLVPGHSVRNKLAPCVGMHI